MSDRYNFELVEKKWQEKWRESGLYKTKAFTEPKFYCLDMPPDSFIEFHMGYARNYTASDVISRFYRMQGYNVFHPLGFFMLALTDLKEAKLRTRDEIATKVDQITQFLEKLGLSYDFEEDLWGLETQVLKWSKWLFLELFKKGFIYKKKSSRAWCPSCKVFLVEEEVTGKSCEKCGSETLLKETFEWFLNLTPYAKSLLNNLDTLSGLPDRVIAMQKNCLTKRLYLDGRSERYLLSDWLIAKESSFGIPVPILHCKNCGMMPDEKLPIVVSQNNEKQQENQEKSLGTFCPRCKGEAKRDTAKLDSSFVSSWFYLLFADVSMAELTKSITTKHWMNVDLLIENIDQAGLNLLHARFINMFLYDLGLSLTQEPFNKIVVSGTVLLNGTKMEGSNTVELDRMVRVYGADTCRWFMIFSAPIKSDFEWNDDAIEGSYRFINRVWRVVCDAKHILEDSKADLKQEFTKNDNKLKECLYQTVKNVTVILQNGSQLNTACSLLMEYTNEIQSYLYTSKSVGKKFNASLLKEAIESLLKMLAPFVPHVVSELWEILGYNEDVHSCIWPSFNSDLVNFTDREVVLQINGKKRAKLTLPLDTDQEDLKRQALENEKIKSFLEGMEIKKIIVVPGKVVNIVAG
ncbi:MAG: class I tRNA ligase family protein [Firmicutes bacterium]|nr:class I tRNA ligase family protein [Bacillota bacterium]MDD4264000.1 class I tRNA ligase family protein [Bacillota bacterium]MDD4692918.1 class I tRNA ligase family protein [Bacillota bacterium]